MNQSSSNNQKGAQAAQKDNRRKNGSSQFDQAQKEQIQAAAIKQHKIGEVAEAKIVHFFKAGNDHPHESALVKFKSGATALLLYNEIPCYPRNILSEAFKKGDTIEVEITTIRPGKNRMSASLVPVLTRKFVARIEPGSIVEATVVKDVNYGYFVDLGGLEALLHNDNLDCDFHSHLETFKIGEKTEVVILKIEQEGKRIGVGRRQLFA